ncbi:MAG TPA: TatD family hydrolase [Terriglobia bacterium]|jgi:TatD DNase family protein|nr:TatD family hydrolase [Terriglobia bacterium]
MLVDSHAHLDDPAFDSDREAVINRARSAGLHCLLSVSGGTGPEHLAAPIPIAESQDWIYATAGVHPHEAQHFQEAHAEEIRRLTRHSKVIAIGEIGLDYHYDHSPREVQKQVLARQLEIAREARLPVVIHCREAWADLRELVRTHWQSSGLGGILHCFSGSREDAFTFLDWGFLISFAGNLTYKKAEGLRAVACEIPLGHLLTETDSPYLAPLPHRGKRNEPAFVAEVNRTLAALRSVSAEEMGQIVAQNFSRMFRVR